MSNSSRISYDLIFIGAGLSCTYTLIHFIERLNRLPRKNKVRICILDKTNEFFTGIPYGNRSGENSLIITSLKEFLPEIERIFFIQWLKKNLNEVSEIYKETEGCLAAEWLENNKKLIAGEMWDKLYIPRHIFGKYLKERISDLLKSAEEDDLLSYTLLSAEVHDVQRENDSFKIFASILSGDELCLQSEKVILCIGSPPKQNIKVLKTSSPDYTCIQDMYEPSLKENINKIYDHLKENNNSIGKNLLIIGSNASSLEVIYNLQNNKSAEKVIKKIYVLSPDGMFPYRINEEKILPAYDPVNLKALTNSTSNTCERILEAVKKDVEVANNEKIAIADIYEPVSHVLIELLKTLNLYEQKQFVYKYGVEIGKQQRRAGSEYLNVVDRLIAENRLAFIKGKFVKQVHAKDKRFRFGYVDLTDRQKKIFSEPMDIVINCVGASDLKNSSSELIQNLIHKKICIINGSKKGFIINENFGSSKDFFVIGPLLSGTLNKRLRIWHAESCPRIFFLAQQLADFLIDSF